MYFIFTRFVDTIAGLRYMLAGHNKGRNTNGVIMDRSFYTLPIFILANQLNLSVEEFKAVCRIWNDLNLHLPAPQVCIHLCNIPKEQLLESIAERNRDGENALTESYLELLEKLHEMLLGSEEQNHFLGGFGQLFPTLQTIPEIYNVHDCSTKTREQLRD
jgi:deoxyadenosine/deoxycytidine kinase